jgi:hypothetical protein
VLLGTTCTECTRSAYTDDARSNTNQVNFGSFRSLLFYVTHKLHFRVVTLFSGVTI